MTDTVYVLTAAYNYEGEQFVGVYADLDRAKTAATETEIGFDDSATFGDWITEDNRYWCMAVKGDGFGAACYIIQKEEVA